MCTYINIFIYLVQGVQLIVEPAYEVCKPACIIHMNNLFCVMQLAVCQRRCCGRPPSCLRRVTRVEQIVKRFFKLVPKNYWYCMPDFFKCALCVWIIFQQVGCFLISYFEYLCECLNNLILT